MIRTAEIASILCNKQLTAEDMYKVLMALKLSRISYSVEFDSCTDLCGYTDGLYNYMKNFKPNDKSDK